MMVRQEFQIRVFLCLIIVISTFSLISANRKLTTIYNPGCNIEECKPEYGEGALNIAYVKAEGENDTLHYLISSIGLPSILIFKTDKSPGPDPLSIDWMRLADQNNKTSIAGAIVFNKPVLYSYGLIFTKLYEYKDAEDKAMMNFSNDTDEGIVHHFGQFMWKPLADGPASDENIIVLNTTEAETNTTMFANGSLALKFTMYNHTGRNLLHFPQLLFNDNIAQLDFVIDNLIPKFKTSRLGLELIVLSSITTTYFKPMEFDVIQSIDDEYAPGVFKIVNLLTNPAGKTEEGFIQWKPVCYLKPSRGRADATSVKTYTLYDDSDHRETAVSILEDTIIYAYFGETIQSKLDLAITLTNVSFGLGKDGWYTGTNYTVWTANIGYGTPPADAISVLVIGIISAGLGLPVIIIFFGGLFVCVKKRFNKTKELVTISSSNGYQTVN